MAEAVKVVVRVRPLNGREKKLKCEFILDVDKKTNSITIKKPAKETGKKTFTFDAVYPHNSS